MYAFLNYSSRCLYKNYIQIGRLLHNRRGFRDRVLHFQLSPKKRKAKQYEGFETSNIIDRQTVNNSRSFELIQFKTDIRKNSSCLFKD